MNILTRSFKIYAVIWSIFFVVFNLIIFINNINSINGGFWIGYGFIAVSFLGQLLIGYIALKNNNKMLFLNTPILLLNYISLFILIVVNSFFIANILFSLAATATISFIVFGITAAFTIGFYFIAKGVSGYDDNINSKSFTIRSLSSEAEHLVNVAGSNDERDICKKVYEALRYSDPITDFSLYDINLDIQRYFKEFKDSILNRDIELAKVNAINLLNLIDERNKKCKILKRG